MDTIEHTKGLYNRYIVSKTDGTPTDKQAEYFVLRLDENGNDRIHREACLMAIVTYARKMWNTAPNLARDLMEKYGWEAIARAIMQDIVYDYGFVDRWNPETDDLYPIEHVNNIKEKAHVFFSEDRQFLSMRDIENIAMGTEGEDYELCPSYPALRQAINEFYENVLEVLPFIVPQFK